jgi:aspartyl protease family protein
MTEETFPERLGNKFTILAWIIVLGLMTYYFDRYLDKQNNPNQQVITTHSDKTREVILNRNRVGHYVATALINDQKVVAMLDTGATDVSIPEQIARKLHLDRGPSFQVSTANGNITVYATTIDKIQIGEIKLEGVRANINPHMQEDDVLLGMSFLKQLEFTQQGDQLTLRQYK